MLAGISVSSPLMCIVVLLKLFNMVYAQLGPTMKRIKYSILFYSIMNGHTIGAILENYDVAMLARHNVMHYNDSLKGDKVLESLNRIPTSFKTVILIFLVLFEHNFLRNLQNLSGKRNKNIHV